MDLLLLFILIFLVFKGVGMVLRPEKKFAKRDQMTKLVALRNKRKTIEAGVNEGMGRINELREQLDEAMQQLRTKVEIKKMLKGKRSCDKCGAPIKNAVCEYCDAVNV